MDVPSSLPVTALVPSLEMLTASTPTRMPGKGLEIAPCGWVITTQVHTMDVLS